MELVLSPQEQQSPLGKKLVQHFTERLLTLRTKNDQTMSQAERDYLLAEIKVTKSLLKALESAPLLRAVAPV